eukprot:3941382-Pleurochrysis_carterae.AAC.1
MPSGAPALLPLRTHLCAANLLVLEYRRCSCSCQLSLPALHTLQQTLHISSSARNRLSGYVCVRGEKKSETATSAARIGRRRCRLTK